MRKAIYREAREEERETQKIFLSCRFLLKNQFNSVFLWLNQVSQHECCA